jgi:hypothetical protein
VYLLKKYELSIISRTKRDRATQLFRIIDVHRLGVVTIDLIEPCPMSRIGLFQSRHKLKRQHHKVLVIDLVPQFPMLLKSSSLRLRIKLLFPVPCSLLHRGVPHLTENCYIFGFVILATWYRAVRIYEWQNSLNLEKILV